MLWAHVSNLFGPSNSVFKQLIQNKQLHSDCKDKQNLRYFNSVMLCDHLEFLLCLKFLELIVKWDFYASLPKVSLCWRLSIYLNYCFIWKKASKIKMNEKCSLIKVGSKSWLWEEKFDKFTDKFAEGNSKNRKYKVAAHYYIKPIGQSMFSSLSSKIH